MHDTLQALEARLAILESRNRRRRRYGFAGLALVLGLGTTAAVAPTLCDTLRAERLILTDANGRERLRINAYGGDNATMQLFASNGRELAGLTWQDGLRFEFKDSKGAAATSFRVDADGRAYFEQRVQAAKPPVSKPGPGGECDFPDGVHPPGWTPFGPGELRRDAVGPGASAGGASCPGDTVPPGGVGQQSGGGSGPSAPGPTAPRPTAHGPSTPGPTAPR